MVVNPDKTQLIRFRSQSTFMYYDCISLDGVDLKFSDIYSHASRSFAFLQSGRHTGHHQGDQRPESKGKFCSVYVLLNQLILLLSVFLIKAYCLSLYDCTLWSLSCKSLHVIQVAINNVFRKIWNLPFKSHTAIVHCVARIFPICNLIFHRLFSCYITLLSYCQVNLFTLLFPHLHILWSQLYVWAQIFKVL